MRHKYYEIQYTIRFFLSYRIYLYVWWLIILFLKTVNDALSLSLCCVHVSSLLCPFLAYYFIYLLFVRWPLFTLHKSDLIIIEFYDIIRLKVIRHISISLLTTIYGNIYPIFKYLFNSSSRESKSLNFR